MMTYRCTHIGRLCSQRLPLTRAPSCSTTRPLDQFALTTRPLAQFVQSRTGLSCPVWSLISLQSYDVAHNQRRFYMRKKTIKILPTKPLNFDYGGDLVSTCPDVELAKPRIDLEGADFENLDEMLKRLFSVEFGDGQDKQRRRIMDLVQQVQEHPLDVRSLEVTIAYQTVAIRNQMRHVLDFRKDKAAKSRLILRIQSRKKKLRLLRRKDLDKFNWLCAELQLQYLPVPEYNRKQSKRAALKAQAKSAAFAVQREKREAFLEQLEQEKRDFLVHKERELVDIEEKLGTLKLDENSYLGKVFHALKEGKPELIDEKSEHPMKRRDMILSRKFELSEKIAKEREAKI